MVHDVDLEILRGRWPSEPDPDSLTGADESPYASARRQGYSHAGAVEIAARALGVPFGMLLVGEATA